MDKRNEFGDLIVDRKITIKEFYELACKEGIEGRFLNIKMIDGKSSVGCSTKIISIGKWWTKDSAIVEVDKWNEPNNGGCING